MLPDQAPLLLKFFFNRIRVTNAQPRPVLRWNEEDEQVIRDEMNADEGIRLEGVVNDEMPNSIDDLNKLLTQFLDRQPRLTRGYSQKVREMEAWLTAGPQRNKMQRITAIYPNNLGHEGGVDSLICITDFLTAVRKACQVVSQRLKEGTEWFESYNQMSLSLSKVRSLLPKVQLRLGDRADLVSESKTLVTSRETFWTLFETWMKKRVTHYVDPGDN